MPKSDTNDEKKICFVAMGFGKKTDYETGRTLDLDEAYDEIIKPAVIAAGLRCIRANEISHSGIIDVKMYEMLLRADLVVVDISTANPNAIYELGVRHALRPFSTIVIKEEEGRFHFDLNHLATLQYRHLGEEIGAKEARRAQGILLELISSVLKSPKPDSPVYTFLPQLAQPKMSKAEFAEMVDEAEQAGDRLADIIASAKDAAAKSEHDEASRLFAQAATLTADNSYLVQQQVLHRYKSRHPSEFLALNDASILIQQLHPENSNDPETLGIAGAIYQRLWKLTEDRETLDRAIEFYERGFDLKGDYYNGENAATLLEHRSLRQTIPDETKFDRMSAKKIREKIIEWITETIATDDFEERNDKKWIIATLANCSLALGRNADVGRLKTQFLSYGPADWEIETFERGLSMVQDYLSKNAT